MNFYFHHLSYTLLLPHYCRFQFEDDTHNLLIHADTQLINSHNDGGDENDHHNDIHLDKFTCFSFFFFCSMRPENTMSHFLRLYIFMYILIVSHFGDIHFNSLHTNHLINTIKCFSYIFEIRIKARTTKQRAQNRGTQFRISILALTFICEFIT